MRASKKEGVYNEQQLLNWKDGKESVWNFEVSDVEVIRQLLKRKRSVEAQIKKKLR